MKKKIGGVFGLVVVCGSLLATNTMAIQSPSIVGPDGFPEEFSVTRDALLTYVVESATSGLLSVSSKAMVQDPKSFTVVRVTGADGGEVLDKLSSQTLRYRLSKPAQSDLNVFASLYVETPDRGSEVVLSGSLYTKPVLGKGGWMPASQEMELYMNQRTAFKLPSTVSYFKTLARDAEGNITDQQYFFPDKNGYIWFNPSMMPQNGDVIVGRITQMGPPIEKAYDIGTGQPAETADFAHTVSLSIHGLTRVSDAGIRPESAMTVTALANNYDQQPPAISLTLGSPRLIYVLGAVVEPAGDNQSKTVGEYATGLRFRQYGSTEWSDVIPADPKRIAVLLNLQPGKYFIIFTWKKAFKQNPMIQPPDGPGGPTPSVPVVGGGAEG